MFFVWILFFVPDFVLTWIDFCLTSFFFVGFCFFFFSGLFVLLFIFVVFILFVFFALIFIYFLPCFAMRTVHFVCVFVEQKNWEIRSEPFDLVQWSKKTWYKCNDKTNRNVLYLNFTNLVTVYCESSTITISTLLLSL